MSTRTACQRPALIPSQNFTYQTTPLPLELTRRNATATSRSVELRQGIR
jgi:hypothetical protein